MQSIYSKSVGFFKNVFLYSLLVMLVFATISIFLVGCKKTKKPKVPKQLEISNKNGVPEPVLNVFNTSTNQIEPMPLETYILGVVAGEMPNNFPSEALKAQAILARTFTLYFVANNQSKYQGADISTDISEAQAYAPQNINDAIKEAVTETHGKVLTNNGEFVQTWFHSNSGGKTASIKEAFGSNANDPEFIKLTTSPENQQNSQNATWSTWISRADMLAALAKMNVSVSSVSKISIDQTGPSGRTMTFKFGDTIVSAPEFRTNIGSTKLKSTFITNIVVDSLGATFSGKGYGHGLGLSQWGAKVLAEEGQNCRQIINHYYSNLDIVDIY